jgi:HEAT repeat protein
LFFYSLFYTDLSRAHGLDHRKVCLTNVCTSFDHNEEAMHNVELLLGAMSILTKCLGTAHDDDEIRMVCAALEMVTRGSTRNVTMALIAASDGTINASSNNNKNHQQQHTLLFHYLLKVLERCENGLLKHADISILNTTKILKNVSRSFELRPTLARQEGLLDMLCRIQLSSIKQEQQPAAATTTTNAPATATSTSSLSHDCRLQRMQLMATLACCDDNKRLMFEKKGLIECVVRVAHVDPSEDIRRQAALILMELASATCNQVAMANDDKVLGLLVKMVLIEKGPIVREAVITALQNLAFAKENRVRLVSFKSGVLLEALKQALSSDLDAKARRRAAGALTNLVCVETAQQMGEHKGLLHTLAIVSTKDENVDVQTRATLALTKIGNLLASHTACHEALMDALVVASLSKASNNVSAVLRVKARDPGNRESMARHPGVVDTLCDLCLSDGSSTADKDSAVRAIMHLCNEANNRKILCSSAVLDALIKGANYTDPELDEARDSAIRALERLGTEPCNRLLMSRRRGLLTAVAKAVEREADWEASGMESEHGYLAKPLLMSLLVSM